MKATIIGIGTNANATIDPSALIVSPAFVGELAGGPVVRASFYLYINCGSIRHESIRNHLPRYREQSKTPLSVRQVAIASLHGDTQYPFFCT